MSSTRVPPGELCQLEIHVSDVEHSLKFYREVFGWHRSPAELHEYIVLDVPEDLPFGIALIPNKKSIERAGGLILYFRTDDFDPIIEAAKRFGGKHLFGPKTVPGYGYCVQLADPDGHRYGLFSKSPSHSSS